jgi:hypothetical protein
VPIPDYVLERIRTSALSRRQVADVFEKLAVMLDNTGQPNGAINLDYLAPSDELRAGDLIPTITLSLPVHAEPTWT